MEHTRFVGLDIHKERISFAVAESGRSSAVEYLGEISNDPVRSVSCATVSSVRAKLLRFATKLARAAWIDRQLISLTSLRCSGAVIDYELAGDGV